MSCMDSRTEALFGTICELSLSSLRVNQLKIDHIRPTTVVSDCMYNLVCDQLILHMIIGVNTISTL